eukprot:CAMPEP_0170307048 /NCGR_PEP_ID=MMETSP0116_2-20130129/53931_1 /TAXON_ID=400756 /ORGANISM="Durinskia baltica, Strain CSIRO CS-38" /LENGTH=41 /DNA_ID= /DNA_START= /DNA_END= /DNA_ORIENTATION=
MKPCGKRTTASAVSRGPDEATEEGGAGGGRGGGGGIAAGAA